MAEKDNKVQNSQTTLRTDLVEKESITHNMPAISPKYESVSPTAAEDVAAVKKRMEEYEANGSKTAPIEDKPAEVEVIALERGFHAGILREKRDTFFISPELFKKNSWFILKNTGDSRAVETAQAKIAAKEKKTNQDVQASQLAQAIQAVQANQAAQLKLENDLV